MSSSAQALSEYMGSLLQESVPKAIPEPQINDSDQQVADAVPSCQGLFDDYFTALLSPTVALVAPSVKHEPVKSETVKPVATAAEAVNVKISEQSLGAPVDITRPVWAVPPIDCLLFRVGKLTLAIPLLVLGAIQSLGSLARMPGQPQHVLGIQTTSTGAIPVLHTGHIVMPNQLGDAAQCDYQYVISLHEQSMALACSRIDETISLQEADVKWRERSTTPWFAGTVKERRCVLLEPQGFTQFQC